MFKHVNDHVFHQPSFCRRVSKLDEWHSVCALFGRHPSALAGFHWCASSPCLRFILDFFHLCSTSAGPYCIFWFSSRYYLFRHVNSFSRPRPLVDLVLHIHTPVIHPVCAACPAGSFCNTSGLANPFQCPRGTLLCPIFSSSSLSKP